METLKFKNDYKLIKTKKIDTIYFVFYFPIEFNLENSLYINILNNLLCTSNSNFKDMEEFENEKLKKVLLDLDITLFKRGKTNLIKFSFELPKENLFEDYNIDDAFKLAIDCLISPNATDEKFDLKRFIYEKDYFIKLFKTGENNINTAISRQFWDIVDYKEQIGLKSTNYFNKLSSITNEDIYKFYKKNLLNNKPFIYIYGNIDEIKCDELFSKYYPLSKDKIEFKKEYLNILPIVKEKRIEIPTKFNQFQLNVLYQVDIDEENRYLFNLIYDFLSSRENNLVFKTLRTTHNLVYHAGANIISVSGVLNITAYVQEHNIDRCLELIDEMFISLTDAEFVQDCLNRTNKYIEYDLLKQQDSLSREINELIDKDLELMSLQETIEKYKKVEVKEIIEFVRKIKKTSTIIFRGMKNEDEYK